MGQFFDVLGQPVGIEPLDGRHNLAMKGAPSVMEQTAIGYLVGQGVPECVLKFREYTGLVEELRSLQPADGGVQFFLGLLGNCQKQHKRNVFPDHRCCPQKRLVLGCQSVDAGG